MPSMPAASNGGEDRVAQTGSAVTRPTASVTGTVTAGSRSGQPAASRAARQASRACAAGTSRMNGLFAGLSGIQDHVHLGAGVQARWPPRGSRCSRRPRSAPTAAPTARTPASATPSPTFTWTTSSRPAADARSRDSLARTDGSGGGTVQPPTRRTTGIPIEPEHDERRQRVARQPDHRDSAAFGQQGRLAGLDRQAVAPDAGLAEPADGGRGLVPGADRGAGRDHAAGRWPAAPRAALSPARPGRRGRCRRAPAPRRRPSTRAASAEAVASRT